MLDLCRAVADDIQRAISAYAGKNAEKDLDLAAEKAGFKRLEDSEISMLLVSEESGVTLLGDDPEFICLLDPLDGTFNASVGIPVYSTSIAFARYRRGAVLEDVKYAYVRNLSNGESYEAVRNEGSWKNSSSLEPSKRKEVGGGTFCVYLYGTQLQKLRAVLEKMSKIRILGCASIELCYVAEGVYDGLIDLRGCLRNIDIAAGLLILKEAGGGVMVRGKNTMQVGIEEITPLSIVAGGNDYILQRLTSLLEER